MALAVSSQNALSLQKSTVAVDEDSNQRRSSMQAPSVTLSGHTNTVLGVAFSPNGEHIATCSADKTIMLFSYLQDNKNWCTLKDHKNAVLEVQWNYDSTELYSCSADHSLAIWDVEQGVRVKKLTGHQNIVNSCSAPKRGYFSLVSASDDGTVKVWDTRIKKCVNTYEHNYQMLAVTQYNDTHKIYTGSLDNNIYCYDIRGTSTDPVHTYRGHKDCITGLCVTNDGQHLLSVSMDNVVKKWNIQPFFPGDDRCVNSLVNVSSHNYEKNLLRCSVDYADRYYSVGSCDRMVPIVDLRNDTVLFKYQVHQGTVIDSSFHPKEPVLATCSNDKNVVLSELPLHY